MTADGGSAPVRSWLYAPGSRPELVAKALRGRADAIVIDLEDAVPAAGKTEARDTACSVAEQGPAKPVWVRVNDVRGRWGEADLDALAGLSLSGVRLPKCEDPDVVRQVGDRLGLPMQLLLESAAGVEHASELARAHPLVSGIGLGETDLAADLRVTGDAMLAGCRFRVVLAARAAGLDAPVQSVWTDVGDLEGLRRSTEHGRDDGFFGRSVIHPAQVPVVNEVFTPTAAQTRAAQDLIDALTAAERDGRAAFLDSAGRFVDPAVVEGARWTLALAARLGEEAARFGKEEAQ